MAPLLALFAVLFSMCAAPTFAQETSSEPVATAEDAPRDLKVGVFVSPPFVMRDGDGFTGMAIDIWEPIAETLGLSYTYEPFSNFRNMINATAAGDVDVGVTNITITRARAERLDFTQPWFDSGLRIMVNENATVGFGAVWSGLADAGFLRAYAWLGGVIVVSTLLLTLFDRRFNKNFPKRWRDGSAESFYTVMSVVTSGRMPSRPNLFGWIGRIMQAVWLICGIAVLAYVTSSVTSVMTALTLTGQIHNFNDLRDRTVAVEDGSIAEDYIVDHGLKNIAYDSIDDMVEALLQGEVDAIVSDAPVLEYYSVSNPDKPLNVVGPLFYRSKYGFAFPKTADLTDTLTLEVLGAMEREHISDIRKRYFGDDP